MDHHSKVPLKVEKTELVECDMNDNIQELMYDVEIKVEKALETSTDWCVGFESGDLLEPLFFKEVTERQGLECPLCFSYFTDRDAILKHNLTHLRVTIESPTLFLCEFCSSYFTDKLLIKRHLLNHNMSKTSGLSYKPKAYNSQLTKNMENYKKRNLKSEIVAKDDNQDVNLATLKIKPKDGMTNLLPYKPKTYTRPHSLKNDISNEAKAKKMHQCDICLKKFTYKHWHEHRRTVHGDGGFFCGLCDIEFKCERYFMRHMIKIHEKITPKRPKGAVRRRVKCDHCDTVLNSKYALTTHIRNVHSDKKHVCLICNSKLKCKSYLLAHMRRVHYDDGKMHMCECGKSFKSPRYLSVHKRNAHSK